MAIKKLLTQKEVSDALGVKSSTLELWRCKGNSSLKWVYIGGMVRYRESDVNDFIDSGLASKPVILNINIPSAFDELPDRTILTRKEVCQIIGKGANAIPSLMVKGAIPRPINEITASRRSSLVWRLGSIRALKDKAQSSEV